MKIKGRSIIELKDVNTGKVEIFKDHNIVTKAVQYAIQDTGMLWTSPLKVNEIRNTPIKTLFGGLLLFDQTITENVDNVLYPGGLTMIGNGAAEYVADGEDGVTEFGSWNYTESGWMQDGSYALVWDFSTTQANGTINCACLTSRRCGYVGFGNKTSQAMRSSASNVLLLNNSGSPYNIDTYTSQVLNRVFDVSTTTSKATYVEYKNIVKVSGSESEHMSQTGKLKLLTKKIPLTKFDLRESYEYNNEGGQNYISVGETEITLPYDFVEALNDGNPSLYGRFGDYYYILASTYNLAVGAVGYGVRINCKTKVLESFTITNNTASNINATVFGISFGSDTVAIYSANPNRVIFQDIFNNSDTDEVSINLPGAYGNYDARGGALFIREAGCIMGYTYYIDMVDRTITPLNTRFEGRYGRYLSNDNPLFYNYSYADGGYWNSEFFALGRTVDYLATINNLDEPVTKTPEKTMKVTYILSFSD